MKKQSLALMWSALFLIHSNADAADTFTGLCKVMTDTSPKIIGLVAFIMIVVFGLGLALASKMDGFIGRAIQIVLGVGIAASAAPFVTSILGISIPCGGSGSGIVVNAIDYLNTFMAIA
ncbi:hypothetical protein HA050_11480 [Iodobacter sp. HSC-16F04]|jgi:type IV secretory pathway VirB2 component (pilin)|uniref:Conjugal transfer protein TrbC n=1 Tax=Iodobacter violaceini TaxID=3044271 RepID=A0ABX0KQ88_9NEIS|nr:TrbC/VirB2 family protein [Iodobacter violacea]NHQ86738.1 hypothetical protein [Iodobacter violacea]